VEKKILFISNGYGEDVVSARVAKAFLERHPACTVLGFPTVGRGAFYEETGIRLAGKGPELPSEGFVRSPRDFFRDVAHGFFKKTYRLGLSLREAARGCDCLVMTGDPYLLFFTSLFTRRGGNRNAFIGVQQSEWYGTKKPFKHHYSAPERRWLMRHAGLVFVRDFKTERYLRGKGLEHVLCAGNPMMDTFTVSARPVFPKGRTLIGVLPGSKREAYDNLAVTFEVIRLLAGARPDFFFAFALSKTLDMAAIVNRFGLRVIATPRARNLTCRMKGCGADLLFSHTHFGDIINEANAVIGTSGTGNEQAAGLGKPVFAFWGKGPQITRKFLAAQKKLLGPSLFLHPPQPGVIAREILRVLDDENLLTEVKKNGIVRMEGRGSIACIVKKIGDWLGLS
jgi:uncharacterized protein (TIGR03492 family)